MCRLWPWGRWRRLSEGRCRETQTQQPFSPDAFKAGLFGCRDAFESPGAPRQSGDVHRLVGRRGDDGALDRFLSGGVRREGNVCGAYGASFVGHGLCGQFCGIAGGDGGEIPGGGFKKPDVAAGKGPNGEKWEMSKAKRIDKIVTPETQGNFWVALEAMKTGKPYPVRAAFIVGTTMFHREANSTRLAEALKALDLLVVQDVLPHETVDYADFVLPATYFLERKETAGVKWALNGSVHTSDAGIRPPEGCEARHDVWIELEIVRRAFPERAERVGYKECRTADEFDAWFNKFDDKGVENFIKTQEAKKPGMGEKVRRDLAEKGWTTVNWKKYDVYPYVKPFGTPTGKVEIYGFKSFSKKGYDAILPISGFVVPPAYSQPKAENEFILVSGKNCSASSGLAMFSMTSKMLGDRTLWMNPADAAKLGIKDGETVHVTGVDNPYQADVRVSVTKRVIKGSVFAFSYQGCIGSP